MTQTRVLAEEVERFQEVADSLLMGWVLGAGGEGENSI